MSIFDGIYKTQPVATRIVQNAYKNNRVAHAFVISGSEEAQLQVFAQWFMTVFVCEQKDEYGNPCGTCTSCKQVLRNESLQEYIIEPLGASIKKEQITAMQEQFMTYGLNKGARFYIVKQAHDMTISAANSLLKFLEEPTSGVYALLLSTSPQMLPTTILSRAQHLQLAIMSRDQVLKKYTDEGHSARLAHIAYELGIERLDETEGAALAAMVGAALTYIGSMDIARTEPLIAQMEAEAFVKKRQETDNFLTTLLLLLQDILEVKSGHKDTTLFGIDDIADNNTIAEITYKMETILSAQKYLHANVSGNLALSAVSLHWNNKKEVAQ